MIGAGPAGSALAIRLAHLGRSVALVEKRTKNEGRWIESLAPGVWPLLATLGIPRHPETAGVRTFREQTTLWGGKLAQKENGDGCLVERGLFDEFLQREARRAGVAVFQPDSVVDMQFDQFWLVRLSSAVVLKLKYLADATGRSRFLPGRKKKMASPTIAMHARWSGATFRNSDTFLEGGDSYWYWAAAGTRPFFDVAVFTAPTGISKNSYHALISRSSLLRTSLRTAVSGPIAICDATSFIEEDPVTGRSIKVGDAALTIDPLSAQGVQVAVGTAIHAAVVINTILDRPEDADLAMSFYCSRIRKSAALYAQMSAVACREQFDFARTGFWADRSQELPLHVGPKHPAGAKVQIAPGLRFVLVPSVCGAYIERAEGIDLNGEQSVYLGPWKLADVLRTLSHPLLCSELEARWSDKMPRATARVLIQWCMERDIIVGAE